MIFKGHTQVTHSSPSGGPRNVTAALLKPGGGGFIIPHEIKQDVSLKGWLAGVPWGSMEGREAEPAEILQP